VILKAPGKLKNIKTEALIEYVDIYPSLCELAGISKPFHLQGKSFVPLTENPGQPWKTEVYCRWIRGETVVIQNHTYTEWMSENDGKPYSRMMYDLRNDPEETVNISDKPENKMLVQQLSDKLRKHISERDHLTIP
jgi:arylsulfatase A-like enzyme